MEEKENRLSPAKMLTVWVLLGGVFYVLTCLAINYLRVFLAEMVSIFNGTYRFSFKMEYLYLIDGTEDWVTLAMIAVIAFVLSLLVVMHWQTTWQMKYGNKDIKGKSHFLDSSEIQQLEKDNILYSFDEKNPQTAEKSGIPLLRKESGVFHKKSKIFVDSETIHSLIIGTTRSGKGQTFVMPMIRYICMSQAKHSMVINDPKGEMLENCYEMLIQNGYKVEVLNLRDTQLSSLWNPLQIIINEYKSVMERIENIENHDDNADLSRCIKLCQSLAEVFTHNDKSDPIWPQSAKSLFVAMLMYLLEHGYSHGYLDKVTLYSLYQFFIEFGTENRTDKATNEQINALDELFQQLPIGDPAKSQYATSNFAKGEMRSSIFSTLASNLTLFGSDVGVSKLTSGNQINFYELANPDKPMALFMVVPDNDTSRYVLASLFVNQCYDELVELAATKPGQKLEQRVHFILDEFGNMVHIPSMDSKITVGAGRNLLFNLFVQDLNQLDTKYDNAAKTIRSNCGNMIYINSLDKDTNEYFSAVLGNKTLEYTTYSGDLFAWLSNHQSGTVDSRPLISGDELSNLPRGTAITKRQRCYPMKTKFDYFYKLGIKTKSIPDVAKDMNLVNINLEQAIYPLASVWCDIVKKDQNGNVNWLTKADSLQKNEGCVWTVEEDDMGAISSKLIMKKEIKRMPMLNNAMEKPKSDSSEILSRLKEKDSIRYAKIEDCLNRLSSDGVDKVEIAKEAIKELKASIALSKDERDKLIHYINSFHNGK